MREKLVKEKRAQLMRAKMGTTLNKTNEGKKKAQKLA